MKHYIKMGEVIVMPALHFDTIEYKKGKIFTIDVRSNLADNEIIAYLQEKVDNFRRTPDMLISKDWIIGNILGINDYDKTTYN